MLASIASGVFLQMCRAKEEKVTADRVTPMCLAEFVSEKINERFFRIFTFFLMKSALRQKNSYSVLISGSADSAKDSVLAIFSYFTR